MRYSYKAKSNSSGNKEGIIEAESTKSAFEEICRKGYVPVDIKPVSSVNRLSTNLVKKVSVSSGRITSLDRVNFLRQLHSLVDADVPVLYGLQLIASQAKNLFLKEVVTNLANKVSDGASLSAALAENPKVFPKYLIAMVHAGEMSGQLKSVLGNVSYLSQQQLETREKIKSSLIYPAIVLVMGFLTVFVLLTFVVPKLSAMFADMGQRLPAMTSILLAVSGLLSKVWWLLVLVVGAMMMWGKSYYSSLEGREKIDALLLQLPFLGKFIINQELERLTRTLSILLISGVDMVSALVSAQEVISNVIMKKKIHQLSQQVAQGESLARVLKDQNLLTADLVGMAQVGEETGRLEVSLKKIADQLQQESERLIKTTTTIIEPVLILGIGLIVGFMVMALLLPIFDMNTIVS